MIENQRQSINYREQDQRDEKSLQNTIEQENKIALQRFNFNAKKIKLDIPFTLEKIEWIFNIKWEYLENRLGERFEFKREGDTIVFTKDKGKP